MLSIFCHSVAGFTVGDSYSKDEETESELKVVHKEKSDYEEKCELQEAETKEVEKQVLKKFEELEVEKKVPVLQEERKDHMDAIMTGSSVTNIIDITSDGE